MSDLNSPAVRLYRHSGEYSMLGMVAATVGGVLVGLALAGIYELLST